MKIKFDYSKLRGRIKQCYGTESLLADDIGISRVSMSHKLNNKVGFTPTEISKILERLKIDNNQVGEYFFCRLT